MDLRHGISRQVARSPSRMLMEQRRRSTLEGRWLEVARSLEVTSDRSQQPLTVTRASAEGDASPVRKNSKATRAESDRQRRCDSTMTHLSPLFCFGKVVADLEDTLSATEAFQGLRLCCGSGSIISSGYRKPLQSQLSSFAKA